MDEKTFQNTIKQITNALDVKDTYFVTRPDIQQEKWQVNSTYHIGKTPEKMNQENQERLAMLDELLDIAALYVS